jgi:PD-(D/E)XK endonuclease
MTLTPSQKGAIAEAVIATEALKAGVSVWRPVVEGGRADLIFEMDGLFARIQCKTGRRRNDVIVVPMRTHRRTASGHARTTYTSAEVDAVAVYCPDATDCYLVPINDVGGRGNIYLRLTSARNNQEVAIRYAATYEFRGAIAQLGERLTGSQEVAGSSPASSTSEGPFHRSGPSSFTGRPRAAAPRPTAARGGRTRAPRA